jgi:hypothetical protein
MLFEAPVHKRLILFNNRLDYGSIFGIYCKIKIKYFNPIMQEMGK